MAIATFIGAGAPITSRSSSIVLPVGGAIASGDTMLAIFWSGETNDSKLDTAHLPASWRLLSEVNTVSRQQVVLLRRIAIAPEPASYTFTSIAPVTGRPLAGVIVAYRGLDPTAPLVAASVAAVALPTASFVCPSIALGYNDIFIGVAANLEQVTSTVPDGATERVDAGSTVSSNAHFSVFDLLPGANAPRTVTLSAPELVSGAGAVASYALSQRAAISPSPESELGDLGLTWSDGSADLSIVGEDIAAEAGLATAVELSLFTDRRAQDDDKPPSGDARDVRGWWGDQFAEIEGDLSGSRLWLLDRSKLTNETALLAKQFCVEALDWLVEDSVVSAVDVSASIQIAYQALLIGVTLQRPGRDPVSFRFTRSFTSSGAAP